MTESTPASSSPKPSSAPMSVPKFMAAKGRDKKLTVLTAYDYPLARLFDQAGVDALLVGDSLGMAVQGKSTTMPVTLDQMIYHGEMVARAATRSLVIVDLPFMSYQVSPKQAIKNAGRVLKETGAGAIKIEGGVHLAATIRALSQADLPVMAHIGMRPQSVRKMGGMAKVQRDEASLMADARAAEDAGAFGIVLELIPRGIAGKITKELTIPTIGIGAGPECDGQVLVSYDMLGLTADFKPRFLKHYADLHSTIAEATSRYIQEVRDGQYPDAAHSHE